MGVDFIKKRKRTFTKAWRLGREDFVAPDLFSKQLAAVSRSFIANVDCGRLVAGDRLVAVLAEQEVLLTRDGIAVGQLERPTIECLEALGRNAGHAEAFVQKVNAISETAEVCIQ